MLSLGLDVVVWFWMCEIFIYFLILPACLTLFFSSCKWALQYFFTNSLFYSVLKQPRKRVGRPKSATAAPRPLKKYKFKKLHCEPCDINFSNKQQCNDHKKAVHKDSNHWVCEVSNNNNYFKLDRACTVTRFLINIY